MNNFHIVALAATFSRQSHRTQTKARAPVSTTVFRIRPLTTPFFPSGKTHPPTTHRFGLLLRRLLSESWPEKTFAEMKFATVLGPRLTFVTISSFLFGKISDFRWFLYSKKKFIKFTMRILCFYFFNTTHPNSKDFCVFAPKKIVYKNNRMFIERSHK